MAQAQDSALLPGSAVITSKIIEGDGPELQSGWTVQFKYTGTLLDGSVFASSNSLPKGVMQARVGDILPDAGLTAALQAPGLRVGDTATASVPAKQYRLEILSADPPGTAEARAAVQLSGGKDWCEEAIRHKEDGNKLLLRNDTDGAIAAYRQASSCLRQALRAGGPGALQHDAVHAAVLGNLGLVYLKVNKFAQALEALDSVLSRDPTHAKSLFRRAKALTGMGRHEDAILSVEAMMNLLTTKEGSPESVDGKSLLNELYGKLGRSPPFAVELLAPIMPVANLQPLIPTVPTQTSPLSTPTQSSASSGTASIGIAKPMRKADVLGKAAKLMFADKSAEGLYADAPKYNEPLQDIRGHIDKSKREGGPQEGWLDWLYEVGEMLTCGFCGCSRRQRSKQE